MAECRARATSTLQRVRITAPSRNIVIMEYISRLRPLSSGSIPSDFHEVIRFASSGSSKRWTTRQRRDPYSREATLRNLKSRAAFKLLEIDHNHHIFQRGQTVVDLGFAPGSWTQVAVDRTGGNGRILGIDILPCIPPKGASTIQGNFLHVETQREVKAFLAEDSLGRPVDRDALGAAGEEVGYIDLERQSELSASSHQGVDDIKPSANASAGARVVDVVLSDMMANTSGNSFRDHALSMDLCNSALAFALDTLKRGGHFICKFYSGAEDVDLERRLRKAFEVVKREKPRASRSQSREQYFVSKTLKEGVTKQDLYGDLYDH
ncbi:FtsJ-like methyltransferase-domain-containing protein [Lipomyces orientalis]|uniref:FtsJ-like methyltransferase-domain-containing protein n=1 Tax=Lipomyces orientalis TaxID=1233043 RepID=A0ACC3TM45_9ASCO